MTPVLTGHARTLLSVNLTEVARVDVGQLLALCANLRHLALNYNGGYVSSISGEGGKGAAGKELRTLSVLCLQAAGEDDEFGLRNGGAAAGGGGGDPSAGEPSPGEQDLQQLLAMPRLSKITMSNCQHLTDEVWEEASKDHSFSEIQ